MTAPKRHWYLIAYDIRDPRRLRRLHYYLRKRAIAVQESVFALHADANQLADIEQGMLQYIDAREDDLRLYAIPAPAAIWAAGVQSAAFEGLYGAKTPMASSDQSHLGRWLDRLISRQAA